MTSIFGRGPAPPPAPTPAPPPVMPDPFSPASQAAAQKAAAVATAGGRQSTVLTATAPSRAAGTIGGGYGGTKLGSS